MIKGGKVPASADLDGRDQWDMISSGLPSARDDVVYNINYVDQSAALRDKRYKIIVGENIGVQRIFFIRCVLSNLSNPKYDDTTFNEVVSAVVTEFSFRLVLC